ncbi:MAG: cytochrome c [Desulfatirhabdiaceae bacterium]
MKRTLISIITLVLLTVFAASLMGAEKGGNGRKGKYTFRKSCRECHMEGGKAQEMSPSNKTQAQWDSAFAADKYKGYACKAEWEKLTPEDINDIYAYMWEHAFDSPSPAKCK